MAFFGAIHEVHVTGRKNRTGSWLSSIVREIRAGCFGASRPKRGAVDYESIFDVAAQHAVVGRVDVLDRNHLDLGHDAALGTEIEHLLGFSEAADQRP